MSTKILCGPCGYEDNNKHAKKWCTNCEEGFCEDCEKVHRSTKMSRNHTLISVSDYQKIKDVAISQTCVGHGKRYDLYCSVHDKPLCIDCVDQHKSCSQLVSLDTVAANAKQSTALADLEDTINGALQNVGKFIKNQETSGKEFDKQESLVKKTIKKTREKLNQHLDILEQKLVQTLSTITFNCKSAYDKVLHQLNLADQKLIQLTREIETMKHMASDIQIFLGTRESNQTVSQEIKSIKSIINNAEHFEINIEIDPAFTYLLDCVNQFGKISVEERKSEFEFMDAKLDQAQKRVHVPEGNRSIQGIDLQLKQTFKMHGKFGVVCSCLILPNGHMLVADFAIANQIKEFNEQGQYVRDIACSGHPYYLTLIDPDRIAITYFQSEDVDIIYLKNTRIENLKLGNQCSGLSFQDGKLYVVVDTKGIVVLDLSGKILTTLPISIQKEVHIATSKNRIYYTNRKDNTLYCLSLTGQEIWVCQTESVECPRGVAVANDQAVFVVGYMSNNLSLIKQNGLECKILLREINGLTQPRALHYNKDRKELLVCSENGRNASVYNVILG